VREFCSHIAGSSTEPVKPIVNLPNPGLNDNAVWQGKTDAHISIALFNLFLRTVARPVDKGARTLVTAAVAGEGSHGSYLGDQVMTEPAPFVGTDQGAKVGRKLFAEVMDVLEEYVPGCRSMLQGDEIGG
jgi:retinol dehydrogenase 12